MAPPYRYYLGRWIKFVERLPDGSAMEVRNLPDGVVGAVALVPDAANGDVGFFAASRELPDCTLLGEGDCRELVATKQNLDDWEHVTGQRPSGETLIDLVAWHLTDGSDIDGVYAMPPLVPERSGLLVIHLGGHSPVWARQFNWKTDPHAPKLKQLLQKQLKQVRRDSKAGNCNTKAGGKNDKSFHQQYAQALLERYAPMGLADFEDVRPSDWPKNEKPKKHGTTLGDTFTDTNGTKLESHTATGANGGFSWTLYAGGSSSATVVSNILNIPTDFSRVNYRAESDLSTDDHYSQAALPYNVQASINSWAGVSVRFASGANTNYQAEWLGISATLYLYKWNGTSQSSLGSATPTYVNGSVLYIEADGSTVTVVYNGSQAIQATDTTYSGQTRCGLQGRCPGNAVPWNAKEDDWEAGDLAAPPDTYTATADCTVTSATCDGSATFTTPTYAASGACSVRRATCAASATFAGPVYSGACAVTVQRTTCVASATFVTPVYSGACAATVNQPTASGSATFAVPVYAGACAATVQAATCEASATFTIPVYEGSCAGVVSQITAAGTGTFTVPAYAGSAVCSIAPTTCAASATFSVPEYAGSCAATVSIVSCDGSATFTAPTYTASASAAVAPVTCSGVGLFATAIYSGSCSVSIGGTTCDGAATFTVPVYATTCLASIRPATCSNLGTFFAAFYVATCDVVVPKVTASGSGLFAKPIYAGIANATVSRAVAEGRGGYTTLALVGKRLSVLGANISNMEAVGTRTRTMPVIGTDDTNLGLTSC